MANPDGFFLFRKVLQKAIATSGIKDVQNHRKKVIRIIIVVIAVARHVLEVNVFRDP